MRLSVVVPIGVIVAVAIVCIMVAVLTSAQRATKSRSTTSGSCSPARSPTTASASCAKSKASPPPRPPFAGSASTSIRTGSRSTSGFGCNRSSITISSSSPMLATVSSMPRSAGAASIRTGSTRSAPTWRRLDVVRNRSGGVPAASNSPNRAPVETRRALAGVSRPARRRRRRRGHGASRRLANGDRGRADRAERQIHRRGRAGGNRVPAAIAQSAQGRRRSSPAGDYILDLTDDGKSIARSPGRRNSPAPRSSTASFPSSRSRSPASRCSPA